MILLNQDNMSSSGTEHRHIASYDHRQGAFGQISPNI
jgi:hypothetical protein